MADSHEPPPPPPVMEVFLSVRPHTPSPLARTLPDGSPIWLPWCEAWLVGAAFWAAPDDIPACNVSPEDFRDPTLGTIWRVILASPAVSIPTVCARLGPDLDPVGGEQRIVELCTSPQSFLNAGTVALHEHARIVRDWASRRRGIAAAAEQAQSAYAGIAPLALYSRPEYQDAGI